MNTEKRTERINQALSEINKNSEFTIKNLYIKAYHDGYVACKEKLRNCLVINPECIDVLKRNTEDPCRGCPNQTDKVLIGCLADPKECDAKQNQFLALEILNNFKDYASICSDN